MKRENILLVAGALLATTSLTTTSFGATTGINVTAYPASGATVVGMANQFISAQAFASPATTSATIGPFNIYVKLALPLNVAGLSGTVGITGATFAGMTGTVAQAVMFGTGFTVESTNTSSNFCTSVLATSPSIVLATCSGQLSAGTISGNGQTATGTNTNGFVLTGITINNATGLATAGGTVSLTSDIKLNNSTVDSSAAAVEITSRDGLVVTATAPTTVGSIDVNAVPAFTRLTSSSLSTVLSNIQISTNNAFGTDLSAVISTTALYGSAEIRVTSASLVDDASSSVNLNGSATLTKTSAQYAAGFVTFTLTTQATQPAATFTVEHNFNGTKEIEAVSAGTTTITFTAPTGASGTSVNITAQAAVTGTAGALTRNGLSIDFNGIYPSTYAPTYTSFIRVANTATVAGRPTLVVTNENTGVSLGTFTPTADLAGGSSGQYSIKDIEVALGITPSASTLYRVRVSGSITGYAQHVIWNQTSGFFTDMSGRRTSVLGNN